MLLRDDKSYPYIYLSGDKHLDLLVTWAKHAKGNILDLPNSFAVRETLALMQKLFIRQCEDSV